MKLVDVLIILLFLIGIGGTGIATKYVPAPDSEEVCTLEYTSNATEFTIGGFGSGLDQFVVRVNETTFTTDGVKVKIGNDSIGFLFYSNGEWRTKHTEGYNGSIDLTFDIFNEVTYNSVRPQVSNDFKGADGKSNLIGLRLENTYFNIVATLGKARTTYESIGSC